MKLWNGAIKAVKTLLTINDRFDAIEREISQLRSDINRIESRIDSIYQLLLEKLIK